MSLTPVKGPETMAALATFCDSFVDPRRGEVEPRHGYVGTRWVMDLQRDLLVEVTRGHGPTGIAAVLHHRTGRPIVIVDWALRVLAAAGCDTGEHLPTGWSLDHRPASVHGRMERVGDWWTVNVIPDCDFLGRIGMFGSTDHPSEEDAVSLEQSVTILAAELMRLQELAVAGAGTLPEFAEFLLDCGEQCEVESRAGLLGYDNDGPHRVLALSAPSHGQALVEAVTYLARSHGVRTPLVAWRTECAILIAPESFTLDEFVSGLNEQVGGALQVGIGDLRPLHAAAHSYDEAVTALGFGVGYMHSPVVRFDELGVWKYLFHGTETDHLRSIVTEWIGILIDYDAAHASDLVTTLTAYLRERCAMEAASAALYVHRNTLRYRLGKIIQIMDRDLSDPDVRFQLDLACRAWTVLQAGGPPPSTL